MSKEHRPYTIPYTGSTGVCGGDSTFVSAASMKPPPAAKPPAPQDQGQTYAQANKRGPVVATGPEAASLLSSRKASMNSTQVIYSTNENDAVRRSSVPIVPSNLPFHDAHHPRFPSVSGVGTAHITEKDAVEAGLGTAAISRDSPEEKDSTV
jgi:hypothetical protein